MTGHKRVKADQDNIPLLAMIKNIMCSVDDSSQKIMAIVMEKKNMHTFWKNPNVANDAYKSQFDAYVTVLEDGRIKEL